MKRIVLIAICLCCVTPTLQAAPADEFVTTWKTDNTGTSGPTLITVPMEGGFYDVDWNNDGIFDQIAISGPVTHDFLVAGTYQIRIRGVYDSIDFGGPAGGDNQKIVSLDQWGANSWTTMNFAFSGASNLTIPATDTPNFSSVIDMRSMFDGATSANPDTSGWDTSSVTDMGGMFSGATSANPDTGGWNTSSVTLMDGMFSGATSFDRDIGGWDVTSLTRADNMFSGVTLSTSNYERLLIGWSAQSLTPGVPFSAGGSTYCSAAAEAARDSMTTTSIWVITDGGGPLCDPDDEFVTTWKTNNPGSSGTTSITVPMVGGPYEVDWGDGGGYELGIAGPVTHDYGIGETGTYQIRIRGVYDSIYFGGPDGGDKQKIVSLDQWGTNSWTTMEEAFWGASNLTITATDTPNFSSVNNMFAMFADAPLADPDTSGWDTSSVTSMTGMFFNAISAATLADPDTSGWDTSSVTDMSGMFLNATSANPDTSGWDTSSVTNMFGMFSGATSFDRDIGGWNVESLVDATDMFAGVTLSTSNYERLLIGWSAQTLTPGVPFSAGDSTFCSAVSEAARDSMTTMNGWAITDGGGPLCAPADDFVTTWQTNNSGTSDPTEITVPMEGGPYDVDWGDGGGYELGFTGPVTHDYGIGSAGEYKIRIRGVYDSIHFNDSGDRLKIVSLDQWGANSWTTMEAAFHGASKLTISPMAGTPNFSSVNNMFAMFADAPLADPDTSGWDTSSVTNMRGMFFNATSADPDTSGWDTSSVTDMSGMFFNATSANPDTSGWDTSNVIYMDSVFAGATSANPDTSGWDTSLVIDMSSMFSGATSFDRDIGGWDVTSLTYAINMFSGVTLSTSNYERLLIGWSAQTLKPGVEFTAGDSTYCSAAAEAARDSMTTTPPAWVITDGGQSCTSTTIAITPGISGSWYEPARDGEGFNIEIGGPELDPYLLTYFYTYDKSGNQMWLVGLANINGSDTVVVPMEVTSGPVFGPNYDKNDVIRDSWGTITFKFSSCNAGTAEYDSPDFGDGTFNLVRLTGIAGLTCP